VATSETPIKLESRVAILEEKVIQLQRKLEAVAPEAKPWWQYVVAAFANDPAFEEAMRLGRGYRVAATAEFKMMDGSWKKYRRDLRLERYPKVR